MNVWNLLEIKPTWLGDCSADFVAQEKKVISQLMQKDGKPWKRLNWNAELDIQVSAKGFFERSWNRLILWFIWLKKLIPALRINGS